MKIVHCGDEKNAPTVLWLCGENNSETLPAQWVQIKQQTGKPLHLAGIEIQNWNDDLTPWQADPVFGNQKFGGRAADTLQNLTEIVHTLREKNGDVPYYLCGYSLAGLFALWAATRIEDFAGIAAVSPSVWYPGWIPYAETHPCKAKDVYLSMGDKEHKTKNCLLQTGRKALLKQQILLQQTGISCKLEWNPGNHFTDCEARVKKGIIWLLEK